MFVILPNTFAGSHVKDGVESQDLFFPSLCQCVGEELPMTVAQKHLAELVPDFGNAMFSGAFCSCCSLYTFSRSLSIFALLLQLAVCRLSADQNNYHWFEDALCPPFCLQMCFIDW